MKMRLQIVILFIRNNTCLTPSIINEILSFYK